MATWEQFLAWSLKPVAFDFRDVKVTAGCDVAVARLDDAQELTRTASGKNWRFA